MSLKLNIYIGRLILFSHTTGLSLLTRYREREREREDKEVVTSPVANRSAAVLVTKIVNKIPICG